MTDTDPKETKYKQAVDRSTYLQWTGGDGQFRMNDLIIGMEIDFEKDIPSWIPEAAENGQLRDGIIGEIDLLDDGSVRFQTRKRRQ